MHTDTISTHSSCPAIGVCPQSGSPASGTGASSSSGKISWPIAARAPPPGAGGTSISPPPPPLNSCVRMQNGFFQGIPPTPEGGAIRPSQQG